MSSNDIRENKILAKISEFTAGKGPLTALRINMMEE